MADHHTRRTRRRTPRRSPAPHAAKGRTVESGVRPEHHVAWKEVFGPDAQIGTLTVLDLVLELADALDEDRRSGALPDRAAYADLFAFRDALDRQFDDDAGEEA